MPAFFKVECSSCTCMCRYEWSRESTILLSLSSRGHCTTYSACVGIEGKARLVAPDNEQGIL